MTYIQGNIVLGGDNMTYEEHLEERLRTRDQLVEQLGWPISAQTQAIIEARIGVVEDEIIVIEEVIEAYHGTIKN